MTKLRCCLFLILGITPIPKLPFLAPNFLLAHGGGGRPHTHTHIYMVYLWSHRQENMKFLRSPEIEGTGMSLLELDPSAYHAQM